MAHNVKCYYCGKIFDRDKVAHKRINIKAKRYAHEGCDESTKPAEDKQELSQEEKDKIALEEYIKELFGEDYVNARIRKQIKSFREEYQYTYSGILKTLNYWFKIKGNSIEKSNGGIGIVPFVYKDASNYYYSLYLAQITNAEKNINPKNIITREIKIESPRKSVKTPRLFNLDED